MDKEYREQWHKECAYAYFISSVPGMGIKTLDRLYREYGMEGGYESVYQRLADVVREGKPQTHLVSELGAAIVRERLTIDTCILLIHQVDTLIHLYLADVETLLPQAALGGLETLTDSLGYDDAILLGLNAHLEHYALAHLYLDLHIGREFTAIDQLSQNVVRSDILLIDQTLDTQSCHLQHILCLEESIFSSFLQY